MRRALLGVFTAVALAGVALVAVGWVTRPSIGHPEVLWARWEATLAHADTLAGERETGFLEMDDSRARREAQGAAALAGSEGSWVDAHAFAPCLLVAAAAYHEAMLTLRDYAHAVVAYLDSGRVTGPGGGARWWAADQAERAWRAKRDLGQHQLELASCP
jgi:hypothetical protein